MKKIITSVLCALSAFALSAQQLYVRGVDPGWGAQSDETWANTSQDGTTYIWDWSSSPKTLTGDFKLAVIVNGDGWDDSANYGPNGSAVPVVFSNGSFESVVGNGSGSKNFVMPSAGATITVSRIELNTEEGNMKVTIKGNDGQSVDPATIPMYFRGVDNSWLDGVAEDAIDAEWKGVRQEDGTYVWDWSKSPKEITGEFKFADFNYNTHNYGSGESDGLVYLDKAKTIASNGSNFEPGEEPFKVAKITLDLTNNNNTVFFASEDLDTAVEETSATTISASNGTVYAEGDVVIYDLIGNNVTAQNGSLKGTYIVVVGGNAQKVNVQ